MKETRMHHKLRNGVLIDSCVIMDAFLKFRRNHKQASELLDQLHKFGIVCYIPAHAYFENAVAGITHFKRDRTDVLAHPIDRKRLPNLSLKVVRLDNEYVNRLLDTLSGRPIPDLKSQDLIYFCIARDRSLTLITEDRKLRGTARGGGIEAFDTSEILEILRGSGLNPLTLPLPVWSQRTDGRDGFNTRRMSSGKSSCKSSTPSGNSGS
jgi:hypothetical protein